MKRMLMALARSAAACGELPNGTPLGNVEPAWQLVEQSFGRTVPRLEVQGLPAEPACVQSGMRDGFSSGTYGGPGLCVNGMTIPGAGVWVGLATERGGRRYHRHLPHEMAHIISGGDDHQDALDWPAGHPLRIAIDRATAALQARPDIDQILMAGEQPAAR